MTTQPKTGVFARALSIVIIFGVLLAPITVVYSASTYTISGTLVNEDGSYIEGAIVHVWTESYVVSGDTFQGDYVTNATSDDEGYFKLVLDRQSYTLIIEKAGYLSVELTVDISSTTGFSYNLDPIMMEKSISVSTPASTLLIHDGERFEIPLTLTNGGDDETVFVTVEAHDGYEMSITNPEGQLVEGFDIASGGTISLTLTVVAPNPAVDADLTVKVVGEVEVDYVIHFQVVVAEGDLLRCIYPGRSVLPSESVDFTITLTNPLYYTKTFQLALEAPEDWTFYVKNGDGEQVNAVTLDAGEAVTLHVTGAVPSDAEKGDYSFSIKANYSGETFSLPLTVTVKIESPQLTITSKYPSQTVSLGEATTYPIIITNPGAKQLVNLSADGVPNGWTVAFKTSAGVQINSILVSAGSSEELSVEVTPSLDADNSAYEITVLAESDYTSGEIVLDANIGGSYGLRMSVSSLYFETNAGTTTTDVITLTNNGYSALNNLEIEITAPSDDWNVTVSPIRVTTLEADSKTTFTLTITPPDDASPQDYLIYVTATSNELETDQQSIRVTINTESSYSIYGIVLLLAGIGIFVLIYKKLKRK